MPIPTSLRVIYRAATQFSANGGSQMGAALAYYALFSTAPLLILAVMLAGFFFGEEAAYAQVSARLNELFGPASAQEITSWMKEAGRPAGGGLTAAVGIALLMLGSLGAFLHVRRCLCIIWHLEPETSNSVLLTLLNYFLAMLAALCVGLLLLLSLAASTAVAVIVTRMDKVLPGGGTLWHWLALGFSFVMLTLFFAVVYHILSSRKVSWTYIWYGSTISAFLFTVGKTLISLYLAHTSMLSIYGAAGSLVVFLVWVYYSSQIAFFGAELIQARRTRKEWMTS